MKNSLTILLMLALIASSCDIMHGDAIDESQLFGKWRGVARTINNKPSERDPSLIRFEFRQDSTYTYRLGSEYKEDGTWYVYNSKLYTHAENRYEIFVHIDLPSPDTMVMEQMRPGGIKEFWTLEVEK